MLPDIFLGKVGHHTVTGGAHLLANSLGGILKSTIGRLLLHLQSVLALSCDLGLDDGLQLVHSFNDRDHRLAGLVVAGIATADIAQERPIFLERGPALAIARESI